MKYDSTFSLNSYGKIAKIQYLRRQNPVNGCLFTKTVSGEKHEQSNI